MGIESFESALSSNSIGVIISSHMLLCLKVSRFLEMRFYQNCVHVNGISIELKISYSLCTNVHILQEASGKLVPIEPQSQLKSITGLLGWLRS